jgi:hypothetical protein
MSSWQCFGTASNERGNKLRNFRNLLHKKHEQALLQELDGLVEERGAGVYDDEEFESKIEELRKEYRNPDRRSPVTNKIASSAETGR